MKLGIDLDGVLADFNGSFIKRCIAVTGRDLFPPRPFDIPCWDYPEFYGYTEGEISKVWEGIRLDAWFWFALFPYAETKTAMEWLGERIRHFGDDVYFITARPGIIAKKQSEDWLSSRWPSLHRSNPTVLITSHKGLAAQTLGLDAYIDDRWENCVEVAGMHWKGEPPRCKTFLMDRSWNRQFDAESRNVTRVTSVTQIL